MTHGVIVSLHVMFLLFLSAWIWKKQLHAWRRMYWPAWIMKVMAGITLGIIYSTYYQSSDTFIFFDLAVQKTALARTDFSAYLDFLFKPNEGYFLGEHRLVMFVKIVSVIAWVSDDNYWIVSLYCSTISFFAAWHLTKTITRLFPSLRIAACIAFLFFPGVVFWSSGLIKESIAMAALFYLTALFVRLWMNERISLWTIIPVMISFWLIFTLKYYYLAAFIPVTVSALAVRWISASLKIERFAAQLMVWVMLMLCGFALITFLHPNFAPHKLLAVITSNNALFMSVCAPDDVIHFYNLKPTWWSMGMNAPWAFFSGLFRPFLWEANTIFKAVTAIQNTGLLVLAILSLPLLVRVKNSPHRLLVFSMVLYVVLLSVFLALSTPNFGTLTRYNVGYLPFVVLLVMQHSAVTKFVSQRLAYFCPL
jgi:hypothetical protein